MVSTHMSDDAGGHQPGRDLVHRVGEREEGTYPAGRARCAVSAGAHGLLLPESSNPDQISRVSLGIGRAPASSAGRVQASGGGTGWGGGGPT